jgi:hypothetical protein
MTQTRTPTTVTRVWGKDRLSDLWTCFEARFRWQAELWAEQRAFVMRNPDDSLRVATATPKGRSCIEWRVNGDWQPYTAWEDPEARIRQIEWIRAEKDRGSVQTFRVAIEYEPLVIVGLD